MFHVEQYYFNTQMLKRKERFPLEVLDHVHSKESFSVACVPGLDVLQTTPIPAEIAAYYPEDNYISHQNNKRSLTDRLYEIAKNYQLKKKAALLEQHCHGPKKFLDFGAGSGALVSYLKNRQWHALGVEPNKIARAVALENNCVLHPSLDSIPKQEFSVISLWHVLEHLPHYEQSLQKLLGALAPGGKLIIAVPNYNSWDAKHYGSYWAAYDAPRHLWHFSQGGIKKLADKNGLSLEETRPMLLDAFYVSLLSERYAQKRTPLFSAFFKGLYSNLSALRSKEYSSIIYVLKKPE